MNPWWLVPAVGGSLVVLEILVQKVRTSGSERANKILLRVFEVGFVMILFAIFILANVLPKAPE